MELKIIYETDVTEQLDQAMRETIICCFPHNEDNYRNNGRRWRGTFPFYNVILRDNDRVVAHAAVIDRVVDVGGRRIRVAGVGNVGVLPDYRKQGHSDTVMQAAMTEAGREMFDLGMLFTQEPIKHVYARNGWVDVSGREFRRCDFQTREPADFSSGVKMIHPLKLSDLPAGPVDLLGDKW
jgi:GNAT superfamily N-acetyltransferase